MAYAKDVTGSKIQVRAGGAQGDEGPAALDSCRAAVSTPLTPVARSAARLLPPSLPAPREPPPPPPSPPHQGGCRTLSGTSVASPVVAGCVALLASTVPAARRWELLNPASMKQALIEGADRLPALNQFEQGNGRVNLAATQKLLAGYTPRASLVPAKLDFTDCPYAWPYCKQGVFAFGMPLAFNATVLNGMGATGKFTAPPVFEAANEAGRLLGVSFTYSDMLWPWSGFLGVYIEVGRRRLGASAVGGGAACSQRGGRSSPAAGRQDRRPASPVHHPSRPPPPAPLPLTQKGLPCRLELQRRRRGRGGVHDRVAAGVGQRRAAQLDGATAERAAFTHPAQGSAKPRGR
jgi:hypothetical protein